MSEEGAAALYERISSDEEFRAELETAETPHDKRRIVTESGYDVSRQDVATLRKLAGITELSDEDPDMVADDGTNSRYGYEYDDQDPGPQR
jgi:predicted ribosomally synthesized peptide with nif11-like leader